MSVQNGQNMVYANSHMISVDTPENKLLNKIWNGLWKKWGKPYNNSLHKWPMYEIRYQKDRINRIKRIVEAARDFENLPRMRVMDISVLRKAEIIIG